ncbi:hypothetical protein HX004_01415 [Myroides sp. 1354]|uniref:hypothetical protein n=1 Tax=unclassified Myroides TaxID=2642485 RepID=UPI0025777DB1|nr:MULTISPECIES: hypothetical protein [unclassified Myroides]MDM1043503.1 hypothetical protein [Myroides sp. R163-1]MDM1054447.1 hypothetical protein [Myroides sp. 1354]MDM1067743.1 hypothetical protein [Myroides sp. 1372]
MKKQSAINQILSEWDPLAIGDHQIAEDEYQTYIPGIIKNIDNKENLISYLENILVNKLEVGYEPNNEIHKRELLAIVDKIINVK